jgi:hypothetical protein
MPVKSPGDSYPPITDAASCFDADADCARLGLDFMTSSVAGSLSITHGKNAANSQLSITDK